MEQRLYLWSFVAAVAATAITLTACGGVECGDNTVYVDGECVMSSELDCPEGQAYDDVDGECVSTADCGANTERQGDQCVAVEPADCGEGTELAADQNECVVADEVCDGNTAYSADRDQCVPTDEICDHGAEFDDDTGLCYPEGECRPGDLVVDGVCATELQRRAAQADFVADGITDPTYGGKPVEIETDAGDAVDFSGTIAEPTDLDGDGADDQQVDVFAIEAKAGDWFEINIRSLGLVDPAFTVASTGATGHDFVRHSVDELSNTTARHIVIPEDGTYLITVFPGALFGHTDQPIGGDDWDYLGTLEQLERPEPKDHDFTDGPLEGDLDKPQSNFVVVDDLEHGEGQHFELHWQHSPPADTTLMVWAGPDDFIGEFDDTTTAVEVPPENQLIVLPDWRSHAGADELEFELTGQPSFHLLPSRSHEKTFTVDDHDGARIEFDSAQTRSLVVTVVDDNGDHVAAEWLDSFQHIELFDLDAGEYTVEYTNDNNVPVESFEPGIDVISPTEVETFDADNEELVIITQDNDSFASIDVLVVHDDSGDTVALEQLNRQSASGGTRELSFVMDERDGAHTVYYYEFDEDDPVDNLDVDAAIGTPVELDDFVLDSDDRVLFEQNNNDGAAIDVRVVHTQSGEVVADLEFEESAPIRKHFPNHSGDFTVQWYDFDEVDDLNFDTLVVEPETLDDFTADPHDVVVLHQENDDDVAIELFAEHDDTGDIVFETELSDDDEQRLLIEDYQGQFELFWYDYGDAEGLDFELQVVEPQQMKTFDVDLYDVVVVEQQNDDDASIELFVEHDDSSEIVFATTLPDGAEHDHLFEEFDGDFTLYWYDFEQMETPDIGVDIVEPQQLETFSADAQDVVQLTQSNDDDASVDFLIEHNASQEVLQHTSLTTSGYTDFMAPKSGVFNVYWYDFGGVDNLELFVDSLESAVATTVDADRGEVLRFSQFNGDLAVVGLFVIDEDGHIAVSEDHFGPQDYHIVDVFGADDTEYSAIVYTDDSDVDLADIDVSVERHTPTEITDFDATYEGTGIHEHITGPHDYYLVEVDETTPLEVTLEMTGFTAVTNMVVIANLLVSRVTNEPVADTGPVVASPVTMEVEFEADETYVFRVGNDSQVYADFYFDYELTFDEVD